MKLNQIVALCALSAISAGTFANTPENVAEVKKFAAEKGVKISVGNESEANRAGKQYMVTLERGIMFDYAATSVKGGYYLDQNKLLTLSISQQEDSDILYDEYEGTVVSGGVRLFTGNSFYMDANLFYLDADYTDERYNFVTGNDEIQTTNFKKVGAHIGIGNQWQWDNFTFGVTWIGAGVQVADLGSKGADLDEVDREYFSVMNLQLGVSF